MKLTNSRFGYIEDSAYLPQIQFLVVIEGQQELISLRKTTNRRCKAIAQRVALGAKKRICCLVLGHHRRPVMLVPLRVEAQQTARLGVVEDGCIRPGIDPKRICDLSIGRGATQTILYLAHRR